METLGYAQMVLMYEQEVGPFEVCPLSLPKKFHWKQVSSAAALIAFIFFGGFTAVVASTLGRPNAEPIHQEIPGF